MKKGFLSLALVLGAVLCLTGCGLGNKPATLTCTQKVSTVDVELVSNFVGNKIESMSMKYDMDLSKYSDTLVNTIGKQDYCKTVQNAMSQYTLVNCQQTIENKHMIVSAGIDPSKISSKDLTGSPSATKAELEKQGYTCTLK